MQFSNLKNKKAALFVCGCISVLLLVLNAVMSVVFKDVPITINDMKLPISSLNGCIQVFISFMCIIMVLTDHKNGLIISYVVLGLSMAGSTHAVFMTHSLSTVPGTFNVIIFLIAITLISRQIKYSNMMAVTDSVTGLLNRYGFERDIRKRIRSNEKGSVIFIHIDGFWPVNANLGRKYGDELLTIVANRINEAIAGKGRAYKIEGAEYALLINNARDCGGIVESTLSSIEKTITLNKDGVPSNCYLTAFAGIADFVDPTLDAETIVKRADIAMNYAMKSGNDKFCLFNGEMKDSLDRQVYVERLVKDGLRNGYFYMVYQPQYTIEDMRLRGFEALIRMKAPDNDRIPPSEFISIAELSDLVLDIDSFVLRRTMLEFREICYSSGNTVTLAVNISAKDIARPGFAEKLLDMMDDIKFPPECLEIEITEYSFVEEGSHTIENIKILRDNQIMIALDDFGTGYTSLGQLMKLPINLVKIDKSLIDNLGKNDANVDFVKSVIYMGHLMDAEVVAEGVEYENQIEKLREMDCDFVQGFIWGKPMEYDEARELALSMYPV